MPSNLGQKLLQSVAKGTSQGHFSLQRITVGVETSPGVIASSSAGQEVLTKDPKVIIGTCTFRDYLISRPVVGLETIECLRE